MENSRNAIDHFEGFKEKDFFVKKFTTKNLDNIKRSEDRATFIEGYNKWKGSSPDTWDVLEMESMEQLENYVNMRNKSLLTTLFKDEILDSNFIKKIGIDVDSLPDKTHMTVLPEVEKKLGIDKKGIDFNRIDPLEGVIDVRDGIVLVAHDIEKFTEEFLVELKKLTSKIEVVGRANHLNNNDTDREELEKFVKRIIDDLSQNKIAGITREEGDDLNYVLPSDANECTTFVRYMHM